MEIPDILERMESQAERRYEKMLQPGGSLECGCGRLFFAHEEGGILTNNSYDMPVCGNCLIIAKKRFLKEAPHD